MVCHGDCNDLSCGGGGFRIILNVVTKRKKVCVHSGNPVPIVRLIWAVSCSHFPSSDVENLRENSQYPGRDSKPRQAGER